MSQRWHQAVSHVYDPPHTHPGWSGQVDTATMPIMHFRLSPTSDWEAFGFAYGEEAVFLRIRRASGVVALEVHMAEVDAGVLAEEEEPGLDFHASLWLTRADQASDGAEGPVATTHYRITDPLDIAAQCRSEDGDVIVGFYTGESGEAA